MTASPVSVDAASLGVTRHGRHLDLCDVIRKEAEDVIRGV